MLQQYGPYNQMPTSLADKIVQGENTPFIDLMRLHDEKLVGLHDQIPIVGESSTCNALIPTTMVDARISLD